ncbi:MAG: cytochrome b/b6 domain-containing protein [Syntrophorhabdaceae bacterium]|nr:cytochrome b/b6 domain-containing protein [Syntrophorhabdaceae bacterium]
MKKIYLHPLPVRIWHWANAFLIIMLMLTGIHLRIPDITSFPQYGTTVALHKYLGYLLALSFLFWLFYYLFTKGLGKHYIINIVDLKGIPKQALYYLYTYFTQGKPPFTPTPGAKFNPLQKLAYSSVMFLLMPVIIITGILFSDILFFFRYIDMVGGLRVLDAIHVITGYCFLLYLIVHIYMSSLGKGITTYVRSMITGYAEEPDDEGKP